MVEVSDVVLYMLLGAELFNLCALAWVVLWTKRAGSKIVDSIAMRLGLRTGRAGKNPSPLDRLTDLADRFLPKPGEEASEAEEKPIEIEGLGSFKPSEIQALAKKYLPIAKKGIKTGELVEGEGLGDLGILGKLAKGEGVGWDDALPLIMELLKGNAAPGQAPAQQSRNPNQVNDAW